MDVRKEFEIIGAREIARTTLLNVEASDGQVAFCKEVLTQGQERLRFLGRYRFWDESNASLETDVRRLRTAIFQREQTAAEIIKTAASEDVNKL